MPDDVNKLDYESQKFIVPDAVTDWSVKTEVAGAFVVIKSAKYVNIRSDQALKLKFNGTTRPELEIPIEDFPFTVDFIKVNDILIKNESGTPANLKILLG